MERKGHGLSSLISSTVQPAVSQGSASTSMISQTRDLGVDEIVPNSNQPRRSFDNASMQALANSVRTHGMLQPILVKPTGSGKFELVAGERRWRAAKLAGQNTVPALIRSMDSTQSVIISIIENLQREDLDPIEEASAYRKMADDLKMTHEQIAGHVGKDRTTIANTIRLLDLDIVIQAKLISKSLTPGHARALLAVDDPAKRQELADKAANKGMSVRELERLVYGGTQPSKTSPPAERPAHLTDIEARLAERLGVRVKLKELRKGGRLVIEFQSNTEFLRILDVMGLNTAEV
jgi:ParB family chromosome partitioning protein